MHKFTKGPWRISKHSPCRIYANSEASGHAIARTYGPELNGIGVCELTGPVNHADAKLIAAAPEMLDALYLALQFIEESIDGERSLPIDEALNKIQKVIKKATQGDHHE